MKVDETEKIYIKVYVTNIRTHKIIKSNKRDLHRIVCDCQNTDDGSVMQGVFRILSPEQYQMALTEGYYLHEKRAASKQKLSEKKKEK